MHDLITKGRFSIPVITKATATIFLLIILIIGSVSTASANDATEANPVQNSEVVLSPFTLKQVEHEGMSLIKLPEPFYNGASLFEATPQLDQNMAAFIRSPDTVLAKEPMASRIPSLTGIITSAFGFRKHPVRGKVRHHNGIDIAAKHGTPVLAPAAGRVIFAGVKGGYGKVIEIDHENGYTTLFAHNSSLLVKVGDLVEFNSVIAKVGSTGLSTGPHIHVEVRQNGTLINPKVFLTK